MNGFEQCFFLLTFLQSWLMLYALYVYIIITIISCNSLLRDSDGQERVLCTSYCKPTIIHKNFRYFLKKPMIKLFAVTYFCDQALVDINQEAIMRGIYWLVHGYKFSQQLKLKIFCKFFQHVNLSWFLENIFSMVSYLKFLKCHFISYIFFNSRTVGKNFHENVVWLLNKISTKIYEDSRTVLK